MAKVKIGKAYDSYIEGLHGLRWRNRVVEVI
jgi:hypothetical protein